jgi:hypothetical protein
MRVVLVCVVALSVLLVILDRAVLDNNQPIQSKIDTIKVVDVALDKAASSFTKILDQPSVPASELEDGYKTYIFLLRERKKLCGELLDLLAKGIGSEKARREARKVIFSSRPDEEKETVDLVQELLKIPPEKKDIVEFKTGSIGPVFLL